MTNFFEQGKSDLLHLSHQPEGLFTCVAARVSDYRRHRRPRGNYNIWVYMHILLTYMSRLAGLHTQRFRIEPVPTAGYIQTLFKKEHCITFRICFLQLSEN